MNISSITPKTKTWLEHYIAEFNDMSEMRQASFIESLETLVKEKEDDDSKLYIERVIEVLTFPTTTFENLTPHKTIGELNIVFLPLKCNGWFRHIDFENWLFVSSLKSKKRIGKTIRWGLKRAKQPVILFA